MVAKQYVDLSSARIAYIDSGSGDPVVFLHGNPTSSFLWRNILPGIAPLGRCIAPDLAGMGDSGKLAAGPESYRFADHAAILNEFMDRLDLTANVTLVMHDWGTALGFDWARRHADAIKGLCYMEGFVMPLEWSDWPESIRGLFQSLRSPAGEKKILEENFFVEKILPGSIQRRLSDAEMAEYRRPFVTPGEDRRPTLSWPRELPLAGEPADTVAIIQAYSEWLADTELPKLFINAEPGAVLVGRQREFCRAFKQQKEVTVSGIHFIQEDSPSDITSAIKDWLINDLNT